MEPPPETDDYYKWMWGDAGQVLEGHALAESNPLRWSDWLPVEACIKDLQSYQTHPNLARPVEVVQADHQDVSQRFDTLAQAIAHLSQYTSTPAPVIVTEDPDDASARVDMLEILYFPTGRDRLAMTLGALFTCIALALCACTTICCRSCCRRKLNEENGEMEASEKTALCNEWELHRECPEHAAFHESELRSLLADLEEAEAEPGLKCLADRPESAQRAEAAREVERVLAARDAGAILGGGSPAQQRSAYRRLVRLLHPDKNLAAGDRATLALRRVVECYQASRCVS